MHSLLDFEELVYEGWIVEALDEREGEFLVTLRSRNNRATQLRISRSEVSRSTIVHLADASLAHGGKDRIWWCMNCERVFRQVEHEVLGQRCPHCGSKGDDIHQWALYTWPRRANRDYPDIPELGKVYPLNRKE